MFYYNPTIAVNKNCDVVIGFTGSSVNNYASVYACGRLSTDAFGSIGPVINLHNGSYPYNQFFWGYYSNTSVDPTDELTFWTIQECSETPVAGQTFNWGTWISSLTLTDTTYNGSVGPNFSACNGQNSGTLTLSGQAGTVIRWESSIDGGSTWSPIANTSTSQNYLNLVQTTSYRAVIATPCITFSSPATVTVNPIPVVTATPQTQRVRTNGLTNIALTSNIVGSTFNWTVMSDVNVSGASPGSGSSIQQTLRLVKGNSGNVYYTVTPTYNGCAGNPVTVTITVTRN